MTSPKAKSPIKVAKMFLNSDVMVTVIGEFIVLFKFIDREIKKPITLESKKITKNHISYFASKL